MEGRELHGLRLSSPVDAVGSVPPPLVLLLLLLLLFSPLKFLAAVVLHRLPIHPSELTLCGPTRAFPEHVHSVFVPLHHLLLAGTTTTATTTTTAAAAPTSGTSGRARCRWCGPAAAFRGCSRLRSLARWSASYCPLDIHLFWGGGFQTGGLVASLE